MARRKYKQPSAYSDAAKVHEPEKAPEPPPLTPQDTAAPSDMPILKAEESASPPETPQAPPNPTRSNLKGQLDQLRTVQFAQKSLEDRLNELGNLSVAQRAWLRARPEALDHADMLGNAHHFALANGLQADTPGYFHMLNYVLDHALHPQANFPTPPVQPSAPAPQHIEIDAHVEKPAMEEDEADLSHLYSAPISHGTNVTSGGSFEQLPHQVTLSAAEREAARASGVDELEYAKNKLKLQKLKANGVIRD